jgi:AAA+ superfamily predicted ATPase
LEVSTMKCPLLNDGLGIVVSARIPELDNIEVFVCDHCDALWTDHLQIGAGTAIELRRFLDKHGVQGGWTALRDFDRGWDRAGRLAVARATAEADPENLEARIAYAGVLLETADAQAALEEFAAVLARDPANREALLGAGQAAEAAGEHARAEGYRRLLQALMGAPREASPAAMPLGDPATGEETRPVTLRVEGEPDDGLWSAERPSLSLADVAGMQAVKRRLDVAFLGPLRNPELRRTFGKLLRGGLLLYGPPGCGKTFVARALAGEIRASFFSIGLADVLDMYHGESERKLHELFQAARRSAPTVLFFDEIDALGQRRAHLRHHAGRNVVAQLLAELDGLHQENEGLFVLGATNHPWDVDTALLRPGRLDRVILVLPPDRAAREAVLRFHLRDRPAAGIDIGWVAGQTADFSGADLAHLCDSATEIALEEAVTTGRVRGVTTADMKQALREVRPSTRAWFETARNYALFANEGGIYDDLVAYMRGVKLL